MRLVTITGVPGSGKSTQAKLLEARAAFTRFSGGDFYRQKAEKDEVLREILFRDPVMKTPEGMRYAHLYFAWLKEHIREYMEHSIVFDGAPRSTNRARDYDKLATDLGVDLPHVFLFSIDKDNAEQRLQLRGRGDGNDAVRIEKMLRNQNDLRAYYEGSKRMTEIDATRSKDEVWCEIKAALNLSCL